MQPVENLEDTLTQRRTSHNTVVDDDEIVFIGCQTTIGDVIDMSCQIVTFGTLSDEGAELDILPHHFFYPHFVVKASETVGNTIEGYLGSIGDIGENGMCHIAVDGFHNAGHQLLTQLFPFVVDVAVGTSAEIDAFERTAIVFLLGQDGF